MSEPDAAYTSHPPVPASPVGGSGPDPVLLSPERLAEIRAQLELPRARNSYVTDYGVAADVVEELLGHADALTARLQEEEATTADQARQLLALHEERRKVRAQVSDWMPTSCGLPSIREDGISDTVLVCIDGEPVVQPHFLVKGQGRNNYFWMENGRSARVGSVTHWLQYPGRPAKNPATPTPPDTEANDTKETEVPRG